MIVLVAAVLKKTPTYAPSGEAASGGGRKVEKGGKLFSGRSRRGM